MSEYWNNMVNNPYSVLILIAICISFGWSIHGVAYDTKEILSEIKEKRKEKQ